MLDVIVHTALLMFVDYLHAVMMRVATENVMEKLEEVMSSLDTFFGSKFFFSALVIVEMECDMLERFCWGTRWIHWYKAVLLTD